MEVELIQLRGNAEVPDDLRDGELFLDEPTQRLSVNSVAGVKSMRLDVQPLPVATGEESEVCLQISDSLGYGVLQGGGGGLHYDDQPWRVPGLIPISVGTVPFSDDIHRFPIEVSQVTHIVKLRINADFNHGVVFGLMDGDATLTSAEKPDEAGPYETECDLTLQPGRYDLFLDAATDVSCVCVSGRLRQGPLMDYPISVRVG